MGTRVDQSLRFRACIAYIAEILWGARRARGEGGGLGYRALVFGASGIGGSIHRMLGRSLGYRDWGIWSVGCFGERASGT